MDKLHKTIVISNYIRTITNSEAELLLDKKKKKNSGILDDLYLLLQLTVPLPQLLDLFVSLEGGPCAHHLIRRHASTLQLPLQAQFLLLQPAAQDKAKI